ncbi:hypothetical protein HMPREF1322_1310 [Porphyromonas gingivalis W50]|nr:hypothetical protein HMPREF1322_1310 [Porphyromonas gingivalis W50]
MYSNTLNLIALYACLSVYGKDLISDLEGKHIAIDGKRLRSSQRRLGVHIYSRHGLIK